MKLKRIGEAQAFEVEVIAREGSVVRARIDGVEVTAEVEALADGSTIIRVAEGKLRVFGARTRNSILVTAGPATLSSCRSREEPGLRVMASPRPKSPLQCRGRCSKFWWRKATASYMDSR